MGSQRVLNHVGEMVHVNVLVKSWLSDQDLEHIQAQMVESQLERQDMAKELGYVEILSSFITLNIQEYLIVNIRVRCFLILVQKGRAHDEELQARSAFAKLGDLVNKSILIIQAGK